MFWRLISLRLPASLLILTGIVAGQAVLAQTLPPTEPYPRVAPGKHFGFITKTDVSADGRFAITVAEDKTARIWDLERKRLHKTLRVPIASGHEGRLYVGAINPSATYAAVGGYTGMLSGQGAIVYLFDLNSDAMYTISELPESAVDNLLFSRDGRYLAVAMANGWGLMVFDLAESRLAGHPVPTDDRMYGIAFGPDGSVIVSSIDGRLNRYAPPNFELAGERELGDEPMHLRYSPDDSQIAVGYRSSPKVTIIDAASLDTIRTLDASNEPGLIGLIAAEWSGNGRYIFAGGRTAGDIETPLLRWDLARNDAPETLLMAPKRIGDIHRLPDGVIYASGMPTLGVISDSGVQRWLVDAATADIRAENPDALEITRDGFGVRFPYDRLGQTQGYFNSLTINPNVSLPDSEVPAAGLIGPRPDSDAWQVSFDPEKYEVIINGEAVPLEKLESPRAHTVSRDGERLFVGTAWFLRAYDENRQAAWRTELTGAAQLLNTSADGRWLIASLSDGTIRWFRTTDGALVLSLFPHANGEDWIAWIPEGYYMSSLYGDELIGWHINKGWAAAPEFYKAVQFERVLYRPDVVQAYMRSYGDPQSITAILGQDSFSVADLASIAPPRIAATLDNTGNSAKLTVSAEAGPLNMNEISIYVNGIPVNKAGDRRVRISESQGFTREFGLPLQPGENNIRVEVGNGSSLGIEELWMDAPDTPTTYGDLYVLAVGVSQFVDSDVPDLRYAAKDAIDIENYFRSIENEAFQNVYTQVVADNKALEPDRATITSALRFVQRASANDTVVLFFASHGISIDRNYYFAPADARIDVPVGQRGATQDDFVLDSFLSWGEIFEPMRLAAGRRLMIVDTCASGDVSGPADLFTLQKRSASSKIAFMTASAGNQKSQESSMKKQGVFTYTVLTALRDTYDPDGDGLVALNEVFELSSKMVPSNRSNKNLPQTPQLMAPDFLASMPLTSIGPGN